jgi:hypothetical protein
VDKYLQHLKLVDPYVFGGCKYYHFVEDIVQAYSDMDMDAFADACFNMDNAVRFDFWELTMLRRIKRGIQVRHACCDGNQ